MTEPLLTITEAAMVARVTDDQIRAALLTGDLRNLRPHTVRAWRRGTLAVDIAERSRTAS